MKRLPQSQQLKNTMAEFLQETEKKLSSIPVNPDCTVWDRMVNPMLRTDLDYIHTAHIDNMITELEV